MDIHPRVMSASDAAQYIGVTRGRFEVIAKKYKLYFQQTSACKIYFESDLIALQETRKHLMKHKRQK